MNSTSTSAIHSATPSSSSPRKTIANASQNVGARRRPSLDARNKQGNTALHYCFGYGYYELGEYLIDKGADDRVVNAAGETPYDGLSADQRRALAPAPRAGAARDAKRLHRDDDRRLARTIDAHGGYSDTESIVALTDDDDR